MALNPMGVLDLSNITDFLIYNLSDYWQGNAGKKISATPLWDDLSKRNPVETFKFHISGEMPLELRDSAKHAEDCQISVYLFHVEQDKYQRNSPVTGPYSKSSASRVPVIPYQPLSLDLYYLVTAYSKNYLQEQRAMSIALRFFHENPILRGSVTLPDKQIVHLEFCIVMESEAQDTLSRLWQSFTAPFRMGVVYKLSVVFITPPVLDTPIAPNPKYIELTANPTQLPYAKNGQLSGTARTVTYASYKDPATGKPRDIFRYQQDPATAVPADVPPVGSPLNPPARFYLQGSGLNDKQTSSSVFLILPNNKEIDVSAWKVAEPSPAKPDDPPRFQTDAQIVLDMPPAVQDPAGAPDAAHAPLPNLYRLCVGSATSDFRSNAVPFSVAAWITPPAYPAAPILNPTGALYRLTGRGFIAGHTEVLLETVALTPATGTIDKGKFTVDPTKIDFIPPDNLPKGIYAVRVRVNHVESDPVWWVKV